MRGKCSAKKLEKGLKRSRCVSLAVSDIFVFDKIDSTNLEARRFASSAESDKTLPCAFIALSQSAGRGRMSRSFYSPENSGIYMTVLYDMTSVQPEKMLCLTPAAAVATVRSLNRQGVENVGIKWVNDIYISGRKVCGILAESFAVGEKRYVALGIGINLFTESFPEELCAIAAAVFDSPESEKKKEKIMLKTAENIICEMNAILEQIKDGSFDYMRDYREHSLVLGETICYTKLSGESESFFGKVEEIDDLGRLVVSDDSGNIQKISDGEISLVWRR